MAKKKLQRNPKNNKQLVQKGRGKGDLVDDTRPEHYELSEEFARKNPLKTPPNKQDKKQK